MYSLYQNITILHWLPDVFEERLQHPLPPPAPKLTVYQEHHRHPHNQHSLNFIYPFCSKICSKNLPRPENDQRQQFLQLDTPGKTR